MTVVWTSLRQNSLKSWRHNTSDTESREKAMIPPLLVLRLRLQLRRLLLPHLLLQRLQLRHLLPRPRMSFRMVVARQSWFRIAVVQAADAAAMRNAAAAVATTVDAVR